MIGRFKPILEKKNIDISHKYDDDKEGRIKGYSIDWESIFVNLITNSTWALEDIPKGSREIRIAIRTYGEIQEVVFSDSGIGIEKGSEDRIFDPIYSTRRNRRGEIVGTGMGLAIVKSFVEQHSKGEISVKSPGVLGGADFIITIPCVNK